MWLFFTYAQHTQTLAGRQEEKWNKWNTTPRSMCVDSPFVDRVMKEHCNAIYMKTHFSVWAFVCALRAPVVDYLSSGVCAISQILQVGSSTSLVSIVLLSIFDIILFVRSRVPVDADVSFRFETGLLFAPFRFVFIQIKCRWDNSRRFHSKCSSHSTLTPVLNGIRVYCTRG